MVYAGSLGSRPSTIALKYAVQWFRTARILRSERPDTVFVMTPPVFAALPAFWYAWTHRKRVVLDAHTAAFMLPRWRAFQWLQRMLCRRASTTLVSNEHLAAIVHAAGGHATLVPDVPVVFERKETFPRPPTFTVAAVCSFDYDEPVAAIFEAAARLPDVTFFVTGKPKNLPPELDGHVPSNLKLTGFLSVESYGGLLADADVVLVLTTYDHTMLRGAYEAIYQGTPVIVSNWPILRDAFPFGAVHVENTAAAIAAGIRSVQSAPDAYRADARRLRESKLQRWEATRRAIVARIASAAELPEST
jgi:glycosyltransferase involved in cell wall biosynthesis